MNEAANARVSQNVSKEAENVGDFESGGSSGIVPVREKIAG
jgi:hypothetical protein